MTELATLKGSEKQINWANDIRTKMMAKIAEVVSTAREEEKPYLQGIADKVAAQSEAKWWIDRRTDLPKQIMREVAGITR